MVAYPQGMGIRAERMLLDSGERWAPLVPRLREESSNDEVRGQRASDPGWLRQTGWRIHAPILAAGVALRGVARERLPTGAGPPALRRPDRISGYQRAHWSRRC